MKLQVTKLWRKQMPNFSASRCHAVLHESYVRMFSGSWGHGWVQLLFFARYRFPHLLQITPGEAILALVRSSSIRGSLPAEGALFLPPLRLELTELTLSDVIFIPCCHPQCALLRTLVSIFCLTALRQQQSGTLTIPPRAAQSTQGAPGRAPSHTPARPTQHQHSQAPPHGYRRDVESTNGERCGSPDGCERTPLHAPRVYARSPALPDCGPRRDGGVFCGGSEGNGYLSPRGGGGDGGGERESMRLGGYVGGCRVIHEAVRRKGGDEDDVVFRHMAPCWRLLEKARRYLEEVSTQTERVGGLACLL